MLRRPSPRVIGGLAGATTDTYTAYTGTNEGQVTTMVSTTTLTSSEQRHATARSRAHSRIARTTERRTARRNKYAPQPFNADALMRELHRVQKVFRAEGELN